MNEKFNTAAETREQRKERLEAYAKMLDESLRKPPQPKMELRPQGTVRRNGDELARQATIQQRVNIQDELDRIDAQLKEKNKDKPLEKEREQVRGR